MTTEPLPELKYYYCIQPDYGELYCVSKIEWYKLKKEQDSDEDPINLSEFRIYVDEASGKAREKAIAERLREITFNAQGIYTPEINRTNALVDLIKEMERE